MSSAPKCDVCDELDATVKCDLCNMHLCEGDDADIHKPAKFASHQRNPIGAAKAAAAAVPAPVVPALASAPAPAALCAICDTDPATLACTECSQQHCDPCSTELHKPAKLAGHSRKPIGAAAATSQQQPRSARGGPAAPSTAKASPSLPPTPSPAAAPSPTSKPAEPSKQPPSARAAAAVAPAAAATPAAVCDMCEAEPATISCDDCDQQHCEPCSVGLHKPARLAGHTRKPLVAAASPPPSKASTSARGKRSSSGLPPSSDSVAAHAAANKPAETTAATPAAPAALCDLCESDPSTLSCVECDQQHCEPCSVDLHKPARLAGHTRKPIGAPPAVMRRASSRSAAVAPSTSQQPQQQTKPKAEEEKEPSSPPPSASKPPVAAASATKTVRPSSAKPTASTASPAAKPTAAASASPAASVSPSSPAPATPAPAPKPRAMSASRSASALRSPPSSQGRPRSAMPARPSPGNSGNGNDGTSSTGSLLSGAPRRLQESLSPTRSVLSMSYGSRWEEPDVRPYKGERVGTFGSTNRDGSPKRTKNLLYSKSASDLLGFGSRSSEGSSSAAHWNRLSKPKVFVSSVISPLFDDVKECSFAPRINPLSASIAPGAFQDRLAKSVDVYVTRALRAEGGSLPPGATFQPQLNKSRSAGRLGTAATPGNAAAESPSSNGSGSSGQSSSRAEFLARMYSDWEKRKANAEALAAQSLCSFTPTISESSKRRAARIKTPFLERLSEDLNGRDDGAAMRAADAARLPWSFQPNPERLSTTRYSFDTFLSRMEGDLDVRKEKYEERCRQFGIPTPEECVALSKTGSASETHRSGSSTRRR